MDDSPASNGVDRSGAARTVQFSSWDVGGPTSFSALLGDRSRIGVYILRFGDGSAYVGQSRDVARRVASHRRRWPDCSEVEFAECDADELDDLEARVVRLVEDCGTTVRNVLLTGRGMPSELTAMTRPAGRPEWLVEDAEPDWDSPPPPWRLPPTPSQQRQFTRLAALDDWDTMRVALQMWFAACLPAARACEARSWTVNAFPSTDKRADWHRVVVVTVNNVELVVMGQIALGDGDWLTVGFLNLERGTRGPVWAANVEEVEYRSVGTVGQLCFDSPDELIDLLLDEDTVDGAFRLCQSLLRRGTTMMRFHNPVLADAILANGDRSAERAGHPDRMEARHDRR